MRWWRMTLVASVIWLGGSVPGAAAECPPGEGTTVVVDFTELGRGVVAGCAPAANTGLEALAEAGFEVALVQDSPAFVCRIDGLPGTETEDCLDTPPASAFWSYWTAELGGDWRFNTTGAGGPLAGNVEGWSFSAGTTAPPRFSVPPAPTTTTSTTSSSTTITSTTTASTTTTRTPGTTSTSAATTTTPDTTTTSSTTTIPEPTAASRTPGNGAPTASTAPVPTTSPTPRGSAPTAMEEPTSDEGDAAGFAAGLAAVGGVGILALLLARRGRRDGS